MISINRNPDRRQLRQFAGLWWPLFCAVLGGILWRWGQLTPAYIVWGLGVFLGLAGLAVPAIIRPVFVGLMYLTYPVGWVISHLVLLVAYFLVVTPIALVLRALGQDPLDKGGPVRKTESDSHWIQHTPPSQVSRYFRQY